MGRVEWGGTRADGGGGGIAVSGGVSRGKYAHYALTPAYAFTHCTAATTTHYTTTQCT